MFKGLGGDSRSGGSPDFSSVDSREKAEALYQRGELQKVLLMPAEFGGQEIPPNVVYVPGWAAEMKANIDLNIIKPLVAAGRVSRYQATPEYQGNSFIPISLSISATQPESFSARVGIWGKGLRDGTTPPNIGGLE